ncbi:hypothetical protein HAX54_038224, partial [Datura stramonium]|nr:hypothetical protein [Datura stramonium]
GKVQGAPTQAQGHTQHGRKVGRMECVRQLPFTRVGMCNAALDAAEARSGAARSFQHQKWISYIN